MGLHETKKFLHSKEKHQNRKTTHRMGEHICQHISASDNGLLYFAIYKVHFFAQIFEGKLGCTLYLGST